MKKSKLLSTIAVVLLMVVISVTLFSGCGKNEPTGKEPITTQAPEQKTKKYYFEHNGTEIGINDLAKPILEKLGEPMYYFEAPSCAFEGLDRIYSYGGFDVQTYTEGDKEYVYSVVFLDDSVATREGISLNASLEDVTKVYGTDYKKEYEQYTYTDDNGRLSFLFEDNALVSVEYRSFIDNTPE